MTHIKPIYQQIAYQEPLLVFNKFHQLPYAIFFDSANHSQPYEDTNRYSYIAFDPFQTLKLKNESGNINPFKQLCELIEDYSAEPINELPPFQGGIAGMFAYDLCHYLENIPYPSIDDMSFPDLAVGLYDVVIAFDHKKNCAWIISTGFPEKNEPERIKRANDRLHDVKNKLDKLDALKPIPSTHLSIDDIQSNLTQSQYIDKVEQAKQYILDGDIFEVNFTQRFKSKLTDDLTAFDLFRRIRKINAAPYSCYFNINEVKIVSSSPERFLRVNNNKVITRPIKGTAPRSTSPIQDKQNAQALLNSKKDRAENIMIVDLMRNDLSKVCTDDSVVVEKLCGLESFATVHHLVSVITATLCPNTHALDLLQAAFPGGSITGAPKVRCMEIIAELEENRRGPYCGSMGFIGFNGNMDTSIIIRTYAIRDQHITYQTGGAIVLDSDAGAEYLESLDKAHALHRALTEGIQ